MPDDYFHAGQRDEEKARRDARSSADRAPSHAHPEPPGGEAGNAYSASLLGNPILQGHANSPARASVLQSAQRRHGNRAVQRAVQSPGPVGDGAAEVEKRLNASAGGGSPLDSHARSRLEERLGADLPEVRVHVDREAGRLARSLDALAFTRGRDIFFREGAYEPGSEEGMHVLAHEATHVLQQERSGTRPGISLSRSTDEAEREAEEISERSASEPDEPTRVSATPAASISRIGFSDVINAVGGPLGRMVTGTEENMEQGKGFFDSVGAAFTGEEKTEKQMAGLVQQAEHATDSGIDWLEKKESGLAHWAADKVSDVPILGSVASAGADFVDFSSQVQGGILKGAAGLLGGVAQMAADPIDTVKGLEAMSEHISVIPGMPSPTKMIHEGYDVVAGNKGVGQALNETFNPVAQMEENNKFFGNMANAFIDPYKKSWNEGKYGEVVGRGAFDIGSLFIGAGEAKGAAEVGMLGKTAEGLEAANAVGRSAEEASVLARSAEEASTLTRGVEDASGVARAVDETQGVTRGTEGLDAASHGAEEMANQGASDLRSLEGGGGGGMGGSGGGGIGGGAGGPGDDRLFPGLGDDEVSSAVDNAKSQSMGELPGQNPATGEGLQDVKIKGDQAKDIAYHENMKFKGIKDSPHPSTEVRYHTANKNAPAGSYSAENPTIQVNTGEGRFGQLPDGTYKRMADMTPAEKAAARDVGRTSLYQLPDGSWKPIEEMTPAEKAAAHYPAD